MAEAAASPAKSESMEDILQSIKRIIEDEPADAKPPANNDVLDLTQMVAEDGSLAEAPVETPVEPEPVASIPVAPPPPVVTVAATPSPTAAAVKPKAVAPVSPVMSDPSNSLLSDEAAEAALAALRPIVESTYKDMSLPHIPSPQLRNGSTVEDLLLEALRPMLKSWLDENLPMIVQKIVEKEVKRIVTFRQD